MKPAGFTISILCVLALMGSIEFAFAQTTGTLRGTVTDPTGAVIPEAHVAIVQLETYLSRETSSNEDGDYVFPAVAVGHYWAT